MSKCLCLDENWEVSREFCTCVYERDLGLYFCVVRHTWKLVHIPQAKVRAGNLTALGRQLCIVLGI